jgi:RNA polymerase sigma-70 factor, ECF subfamily
METRAALLSRTGPCVPPEETTRAPRLTSPTPDERLRQLVDAHFGLVWRTLRFHGVPEAGADDAAQQVFFVLARRLAEIQPGTERAFLFATSFRVASDARRAALRRPAGTEEDLAALQDPIPSADVLLDQARARAVLHEVLDEMPSDVRAVFVLIEIEELALAEVAKIIGAPIGTVSSRLRRGRQMFEGILKRRRAAESVGRTGGRK